MKNIVILNILLMAFAFNACDEREPEVEPLDENFPFRLVLDTDEGAAIAETEDYGLEIAFADYLGELPATPVTLNYVFSDAEGSFTSVEIDEVVYTVEIDDCEYERELDFDGSQIFLTADEDLGSLPESFEVVFALPGTPDAEGGFVFEITGIETTADILLNEAASFEYEVLESDLAGEWEIILSETEFESFKSFFSLINSDLNDVGYTDFEDGLVAVEFEFEEMKFEIELLEEEEVCEDGEFEMEAKTVEVELEWDEDNEEFTVGFEGSRTFNDDGITVELDIIAEADYEINGDVLTLTFTNLIDEDNYEEGEELFTGSQSFILVKN